MKKWMMLLAAFTAMNVFCAVSWAEDVKATEPAAEEAPQIIPAGPVGDTGENVRKFCPECLRKEKLMGIGESTAGQGAGTGAAGAAQQK